MKSSVVLGGAIAHLQLWLCALTVLVFAAMPPAEGAMLLVPIDGRPTLPLNAALGHGARLLGAGTIPGSVVVEADRSKIAAAVLATGTLVIAAAPLLCGNPSPAGKIDR